MQSLKARVQHGRLVLDEPSDLPDGKIVPLVPLDEVVAGDDDSRLSPEDSAGLKAALASFRDEQGRTHEQVLRRIEDLLRR